MTNKVANLEVDFSSSSELSDYNLVNFYIMFSFNTHQKPPRGVLNYAKADLECANHYILDHHFFDASLNKPMYVEYGSTLRKNSWMCVTDFFKN